MSCVKMSAAQITQTGVKQGGNDRYSWISTDLSHCTNLPSLSELSFSNKTITSNFKLIRHNYLSEFLFRQWLNSEEVLIPTALLNHPKR